ncbi:restriction endonuclease subunit S [Lacticaseibacillus paracasei]|uniref:restriction endonuclease subunit S n=1 Tax=Lacticaseibacillus paracasei TaxID=1597 RepID=UPI000F0B1404|nr:restriction endonuclease subunit S [Lacticaseibacillus paracasei]RNE03985.1 EcoKI restriction-modification system protein HsdS [Lacticaseibacillus paracasei]
MNAEQHVPQFRFKDFSDSWEQRKLTEIVNRVNKSSNSDVLPKVEFEDIVSGEGRLNKDISSKFDSRKGTLFEPENILYGKLRPYLKNWLFSDFEGVALGDFWVFEATDVSVPSFDYYLIQSDDYQKVANDTSGTKMPRSDWKNVSSTDFAIPSKDEQKQIGAFFKQLDDTITLHQRKLAKLKELKKGYLQKLFPQNSEKVPEFRFKGYSDAWEKRKLGELAEFINGRAYKQDELLTSGKYPVLRVGNFYTNDKWYYSDLELPEKYYAEKGDLLYTWSATFGPHIWIGPKVIYHYHIWKVALKNLFEKDFALQFFEADRVRLLNSTNGSTMIHVTKKEMESKGILLPDISEQRNIGELLRKADDLIAATQCKLDLLKKLKKGYLQKMFC